MQNIFYKPEDAWCGDFIPFYKDGLFRLFYLKDWRNKQIYGEGTPWYQIVTNDFVHYKDLGEMIPRGTPDEQDLYVYTGCVIEAEGRYHIFYTGHNPHMKEKGKPVEAVMHAVSDDLVNWTKVYEDTFYAPQDIYEPDDWRDPFVFKNDEDQAYYMLLAARLKTGPSRRRGCTALCRSYDLKQWEVCEPFWSPGLYYTHECPDLFKMGDWWYLIFSAFSDNFVTYYRMSRSLKGPWIKPENDNFDNRAFYAAKTASSGDRRFLFGWNPTRQDEKDYHDWHWGGNLVVHEIIQQSDGTLQVKPVPEIAEHFSEKLDHTLKSTWGDWSSQHTSLVGQAEGSFACALFDNMPDTCKITGKIKFDESVRDCGLMLRAADNMDDAYYLRLEPHLNRVVFDTWPRKRDVPHMVELERPLKLVAGEEYQLTVLVSGTICEVYINDEIALSARMYNKRDGRWGLFSSIGKTQFSDFNIFTVKGR